MLQLLGLTRVGFFDLKSFPISFWSSFSMAKDAEPRSASSSASISGSEYFTSVNTSGLGAAEVGGLESVELMLRRVGRLPRARRPRSTTLSCLRGRDLSLRAGRPCGYSWRHPAPRPG